MTPKSDLKEAFESICNRNIGKLKKLLAKGLEVNAGFVDQRHTLLHLACGLEKEEDGITVVKLLIQHGAKLNIQNAAGKTCMHAAASRGHDSILSVLLANGGNALLCDVMGYSPIDDAFNNNHFETAEKLSRFLDGEVYSQPSDEEQKFTLKFWRCELVEVLPSSQQSSSDSYFSCLSLSVTPAPKGKNIQNIDSKALYNPPCFKGTYKMDECRSDGAMGFELNENSVPSHNTIDAECNKTACFNCNSIGYFKSSKILDIQYINKRTAREKENTGLLGDSSVAQNQSKGFVHLGHDLRKHGMNHDLKKHKTDKLMKCEVDCDDLMKHEVECDDLFKHEVDCGGDKFMLLLHRELQKCETESVDDMKSFQLCLRNALKQSAILAQSFPNNESSILNTGFLSDVTERHCIECAHSACKSGMKVSCDCSVSDMIEIQAKPSCSVTAKVDSDAQSEHDSDFTASSCSCKCASHVNRGVQNSETCKNHETDKQFNFEKEMESIMSNSVQSKQSAADQLFSKRKKATEVTSCHLKTQLGHQESNWQNVQHAVSSSWLSSLPSTVSLVEEFIYMDKEQDIVLVERRCPSSTSLTGSEDTESIKSISKKSTTGSIPIKCAPDESIASVGTITESVKGLSGEELRAKMAELGFSPGPVTPTTKRVLQRHFIHLRKNPQAAAQENSERLIYSRELHSVLSSPASLDMDKMYKLEMQMCAPFDQPDPLLHWRDGNSKTCFNYLLLDPRITCNLPLRSHMLSKSELFQVFIKSVFYIGKGSRGRPYFHLYAALRKTCKKTSRKIAHIKEIWEAGLGVVSLHVFQNTIPVEAWTREAAMISAIGLKHLCNNIQGTFYGPASTWRWRQCREVGCFLLHRALHVLLHEGERQLRPPDLSVPAWL